MEFPLTANKAKWFPVYERVDVSEKPEPAGPYRCMLTGALCGLKPLMFTFSDQSLYAIAYDAHIEILPSLVLKIVTKLK